MENVQNRVLYALQDGQARNIVAVRVFADCTDQDIQNLVEAGLIRIPDVLNGGRLVCITPKGTEALVKKHMRR